MEYIQRKISPKIQEVLKAGKSVLLLGPRQTGKTTLVMHELKPSISYSFARLQDRQRYEKNPVLFEQELEAEIEQSKSKPLVFIDEVQKIPRVMDTIQNLIDHNLAQFILSGSSARKLKHGPEINLLPGRVIKFTMTPLLYSELPEPKSSLENILLYGTLPGMVTEKNEMLREELLSTYVTTYLEDEIRSEAIVRNVGSFARFLELAAGEMGKQLNFTRLSQDIGVSDTAIANYYQILEDCLVATHIDPITQSKTKRRLIKSPKYLFFDLGVRRACAHEGIRLPQKTLGDLFEQYVGTELLHQITLASPHIQLKYWRDSADPEVDYVIDDAKKFIPIEVKYTDNPQTKHIRHLKKFLDEYEQAEKGYVVCRVQKRLKLSENITAIPWQEIDFIFQ